MTERTVSHDVKLHEDICKTLTALYIAKNHDYGDSFHKTYLRYGMTMPCIRMEDKLNRLIGLAQGKEVSVNETIDDTLMDLANYAILTLISRQRMKEDYI